MTDYISAEERLNFKEKNTLFENVMWIIICIATLVFNFITITN